MRGASADPTHSPTFPLFLFRAFFFFLSFLRTRRRRRTKLGLAASPEQLLAGEEDDDVCSGSVRFSGDPVELIQVELPFATGGGEAGGSPSPEKAPAPTTMATSPPTTKRVTISPGVVQGAREAGPSPTKRLKRPHDGTP